jgi:hypothetical protein
LGVAACGGGGGGGSGGIGGTTGGSAQDLASVTPSPQVAARNAEPGAFAADYLRSTHFTTLLVEVDYPLSRPPSLAVLQLLEQRLFERCDKLDVVVVLDDPIPDSRFPAVLSTADVQDIEDEYRDTFPDLTTRTAAAYLLYTLGNHEDDVGNAVILGIAHRGGSVALFVENADSSGGALYSDEDFEAHGVVHELGHLLGLVNGGVPMVEPHEDLRHPYHTVDRDCVMYWSIGGGGPVTPHLGDPDFAAFGAYSTQDVQAFGGN